MSGKIRPLTTCTFKCCYNKIMFGFIEREGKGIENFYKIKTDENLSFWVYGFDIVSIGVQILENNP